MKHQFRSLYLSVLIAILAIGSAGCENRVPNAPVPATSDSSESLPSEGDDLLQEDTPIDELPSNPEEDAPQDAQKTPESTTYKIADSGYQVTVTAPLALKINELMGSISVYVEEDETFQGSILYEVGKHPLEQIKQMMAYGKEERENDKSITNYQEDIQEFDDGTFRYIITYSAGETEEGPAGFFYVLYQKTADGLVTFNINSPQVVYDEVIREMFTTVAQVTDTAIEVPAS